MAESTRTEKDVEETTTNVPGPEQNGARPVVVVEGVRACGQRLAGPLLIGADEQARHLAPGPVVWMEICRGQPVQRQLPVSVFNIHAGAAVKQPPGDVNGSPLHGYLQYRVAAAGLGPGNPVPTIIDLVSGCNDIVGHVQRLLRPPEPQKSA